MKNEDYFEIESHIITRKLGNELVVLNISNGEYYGLNEVGARVWEFMAGGKRFDEISKTLVNEYDVAESVVENDLTRLLKELLEVGLIKINTNRL